MCFLELCIQKLLLLVFSLRILRLWFRTTVLKSDIHKQSLWLYIDYTIVYSTCHSTVYYDYIVLQYD